MFCFITDCTSLTARGTRHVQLFVRCSHVASEFCICICRLQLHFACGRCLFRFRFAFVHCISHFAFTSACCIRILDPHLRVAFAFVCCICTLPLHFALVSRVCVCRPALYVLHTTRSAAFSYVRIVQVPHFSLASRAVLPPRNLLRYSARPRHALDSTSWSVFFFAKKRRSRGEARLD
jgi:hypothetical protein